MWEAISGLWGVIKAILALFSDKAKDKRAYEKAVRDAIRDWESQTGDATKLRDSHERVLAELHEKWERAYGTPVFKLRTPPQVKAGEPFTIQVSARTTTEIWRDRKYFVALVGPREEITLNLASKGSCILELKDGDSFHSAASLLVV
jgi:hypothetical protein